MEPLKLSKTLMDPYGPGPQIMGFFSKNAKEITKKKKDHIKLFKFHFFSICCNHLISKEYYY